MVFCLIFLCRYCCQWKVLISTGLTEHPECPLGLALDLVVEVFPRCSTGHWNLVATDYCKPAGTGGKTWVYRRTRLQRHRVSPHPANSENLISSVADFTSAKSQLTMLRLVIPLRFCRSTGKSALVPRRFSTVTQMHPDAKIDGGRRASENSERKKPTNQQWSPETISQTR